MYASSPKDASSGNVIRCTVVEARENPDESLSGNILYNFLTKLVNLDWFENISKIWAFQNCANLYKINIFLVL
jgi:hypothetical protein